MENSTHHQFILKPSLPAVDHRIQFELYAIPSSSDWFSWDYIHQIEKTSLPEFFNGTSITRNPRVYKEYRDFIISKFREDPSRRLTLSEVRKSLVGDVNYLLKVFRLLENWGLINYGLPEKAIDGEGDGDGDGDWEDLVKVEEGPPNGVRVVAVPNSLKPVSVGVGSGNGCGVVEGEVKMPPLASHLDVFQELVELVCGKCKERCEAGYYECSKNGSSIICTKCFKEGSYGTNKSADDYKFVDHTPENGTHAASWSESETLLLLESVLKHGDDWDLVAQNVQTKSKQDCISKLLQLPFGHLMLGPTNNKHTNNGKQGLHEIKDTGSQHVEVENMSRHVEVENESQRVEVENESQHVEVENESQNVEVENESQQNGDADIDEPPSKRICLAPVSNSSNLKMETNKEEEQVAPSLPLTEEVKEKDGQIREVKNQKHLPDVGNSLMQQVAHIAAVVGPHVTASAAEAAITALCDENEIPKGIFDSEENGNGPERTVQGNGLEMDARPIESDKGVIPLPLRMRATSATALGAAAAHAKLLAVQEEREIESLVSSVINAQLKKLEYKMGLLNEAEGLMEKEYNQMMEIEESLITERMDVVQKVIDRRRDKEKTTVKPLEQIIP
ncbi:SWI/SNF complex subunit SWI3A-like [Bidens hawaiensis]|uniref:SWI/SNF complex subunit SWI3A-like n=1 Tax=Bidens hawaiensis TaxID=980011 RepID=UPI00404AB70E